MNWMTVVYAGLALLVIVLAIIGFSIMCLAGDLDQQDEDRYGVDRARRS